MQDKRFAPELEPQRDDLSPRRLSPRDEFLPQDNPVSPAKSPDQTVTPNPALSLVGKLAEAFANVGGLEKKGKNVLQNYAYLKAADVAKAIRHQLFERGVIMTSDVENTQWSEFQTMKGSRMTVCRLTVRFTFYDSDSKETISFRGSSEAFDSGDKASYKAITGALKYALRTAGLIPDEKDDPEGDEKVDKIMGEEEAARVEKEHLDKFQEREKVQPPPVPVKQAPRQAEGVVVLTKISEAKTKKGDIYWKMDVTDVNGQSSLVSVFDKKLMIPELWNASGKDLRIKVGSRASGDKIYYNLLSIQQIGAKELAGEEEIPMFDGE